LEEFVLVFNNLQFLI